VNQGEPFFFGDLYTAQAIMVPKEELLKWDGDPAKLDQVKVEAHDRSIDTIPVERDGRITEVLSVHSNNPQPLTSRWLVARDTPLRMVLRIFATTSSACRLVLFGDEVIGLVTPADFNRLEARTYYYNVIAGLEMALLDRIKAYGRRDDELLQCVDPNENRLVEIQKEISTPGYELGILHALYLSELIAIVKNDEVIRKELGYSSKKGVKNDLGGLVNLRNDVMHPVRLVIKGNDDLAGLYCRLERAYEIIKNKAP
jgi:hypothetical protein